MDELVYDLMYLDFLRIKQGNRIGYDNKPYDLDYYDLMIKYFETEEEYEKCAELKSIISSIEDHNKNYS